MTVLGKSSFCNHQHNKCFRQEASTDVLTIGWKIIGEQDNHIVSKYYPIDYFLGTKENWTFIVQKTREHQLNQMTKLSFTNWETSCVSSYMQNEAPDAIHAVSKYTHTQIFNQSFITRKWDNPDYGTVYRTTLQERQRQGGRKKRLGKPNNQMQCVILYQILEKKSYKLLLLEQWTL